MKRYNLKTVIAFFVFLSLGNGLQKINAQQLASYYMWMVPQSVQNNPAYFPECNFYIGLPALSSIYFRMDNGAFNFKKIFIKRSDDSLTLDANNLLKSFHKVNYLAFNAGIEDISFGFKMKKSYLTFSLSQKIYARFEFPQEMMKLMINGNLSETFLNRTVDFSGFHADAVAYHELAIGYNKIINDKWTAGIRPKMLVGLATLHTEKNNLTVFTADESHLHDITVNSDILVNMNVPDFESDSNSGFDPKKIMDMQNLGFGVDLGVRYKISKKMSVSLAALDLGYINWNSNPKNESYKASPATFTFAGLELNDLFNKNSSDSAFKNSFDKLRDSVNKVFDTRETENSFKTKLFSKYIADFTFSPTKKDRLGLVVRMEPFYKKIYPSVLAGYCHSFGKTLQLSINYAYQNYSSNLGFGYAVNGGSFQLYMILDNLLPVTVYDRYVVDKEGHSIPVPRNINQVGFHWGFNLVFGKRNSLN